MKGFGGWEGISREGAKYAKGKRKVRGGDPRPSAISLRGLCAFARGPSDIGSVPPVPSFTPSPFPVTIRP